MMVQKSHTHMFIHLRRHIFTLIILIILLLVLIIGLSLLNANMQNKTASIISEIGRQRMLTQMMAKDASRVSVLSNALDSETSIESDVVLKGKIFDAKQKIISAIYLYDNTLHDIKTGNLDTSSGVISVDYYAKDPEIKLATDKGEIIWKQFKEKLYVITTTDFKDDDFKTALIYINANNMQLLASNELILTKINDRMDATYTSTRNLYLSFISTILLLLGIAIYRLYFYLFKPIEEMYWGFSKIGLLNDGPDPSKTKGNLNRVVNEVKTLFNGIYEMMHLIENINLNTSFDDTLKYIYKTFIQYIPYTYIGIALFRGHEDEKIVASYGITGSEHIGLDTELLGTTVNMGETSLKNIIRQNTPRVINDLDAYFEGKELKSYSKTIMKHGIKASITLPLMINNKQIGFIFFSSNKKNVYHPTHVEFLKTVSNAIAISFEKHIFVDDLVYSSVLALAKLAEARDEDTGDHLVRMKNYVIHLSNLLKAHSKYANEIDSKFMYDMEKFSPMHDIGKVGIPDHILLKPGRLTFEEFEIMKTHTIYGANVLAEAEANIMRSGRSLFSEGIAIAESHHEKWDGSGYPNGLKGEEIPLSARVIALADVFDALLSKRPYKEPFSFEKTVSIIAEGRGKHFDPIIVDVFLEHIDSFQSLYLTSNKTDIQIKSGS